MSAVVVSYRQGRIDVSEIARRVLPARPGRRYLLLQNIGPSTVHFAMGDTAEYARAGMGFQLLPGASFELKRLSDADPAPDLALWASVAEGYDPGVLASLEG